MKVVENGNGTGTTQLQQSLVHSTFYSAAPLVTVAAILIFRV